MNVEEIITFTFLYICMFVVWVWYNMVGVGMICDLYEAVTNKAPWVNVDRWRVGKGRRVSGRK